MRPSLFCTFTVLVVLCNLFGFVTECDAEQKELHNWLAILETGIQVIQTQDQTTCTTCDCSNAHQHLHKNITRDDCPDEISIFQMSMYFLVYPIFIGITELLQWIINRYLCNNVYFSHEQRNHMCNIAPGIVWFSVMFIEILVYRIPEFYLPRMTDGMRVFLEVITCVTIYYSPMLLASNVFPVYSSWLTHTRVRLHSVMELIKWRDNEWIRRPQASCIFLFSYAVYNSYMCTSVVFALLLFFMGCICTVYKYLPEQYTTLPLVQIGCLLHAMVTLYMITIDLVDINALRFFTVWYHFTFRMNYSANYMNWEDFAVTLENTSG
jgi:hypothetical protein